MKKMKKEVEPFSGVRPSKADITAKLNLLAEIESFLDVTLRVGPIPKFNTMGPYRFEVVRDVSKKREWRFLFETLDSFAYSEGGEGSTLAEAWANFLETRG